MLNINLMPMGEPPTLVGGVVSFQKIGHFFQLLPLD